MVFLKNNQFMLELRSKGYEPRKLKPNNTLFRNIINFMIVGDIQEYNMHEYLSILFQVKV